VRIYHSSGSEPMILDSITELNELHARLKSFFASEQRAIRLSADETFSTSSLGR
jgi:hypothetical protein